MSDIVTQLEADLEDAQKAYDRLAADHNALAKWHAAGYDAAYARGFAAGVEQAAKVCDERAAHVFDILRRSSELIDEDRLLAAAIRRLAAPLEPR